MRSDTQEVLLQIQPFFTKEWVGCLPHFPATFAVHLLCPPGEQAAINKQQEAECGRTVAYCLDLLWRDRHTTQRQLRVITIRVGLFPTFEVYMLLKLRRY